MATMASSASSLAVISMAAPSSSYSAASSSSLFTRSRRYGLSESLQLMPFRLLPFAMATTAISSSVSSPQTSLEFRTFLEATEKGSIVPVFQRIFSDHLTPVLAYRCLVKEDDREAPSFLFESVENSGGCNIVGRYSMVGAQPSMEIVAKEDLVTVLNHKEGTREEIIMDDPMNFASTLSSKWKVAVIDGLPDIFFGGWVGYFSYDTVRYEEKKKLPFRRAPEDDRGLPDIHLGLYDDVIVFDHVAKVVYAVHWVHIDHYESTEIAFKNGKNKLGILVSRLQRADMPKLSSGCIDLSIANYGPAMELSNMTEEVYKKAVLKAKEHILAGDIFQIVLSQRFERRTYADPFDVYRALRVVNPSPYMIYLQARGCILVASSPEILTRIKKGKIINRPLAGTRRRGRTLEEDKLLQAELLKDEKECAEHIMLVDLGRNDVGKVAKAGSVKVEKLMNVERYSHVMHISSTVTGQLLDHLSCWDALRAALPVGTVSGAPKVKAMELIDELEPTRRGPYSGGIGGISYTGDMDMALALRTMVFRTSANRTMVKKEDHDQEWVVHLQAGAGIVADSKPDDEYRECINKASGLARAIDLAEAAFVHKNSSVDIDNAFRMDER